LGRSATRRIISLIASLLAPHETRRFAPRFRRSLLASVARSSAYLFIAHPAHLFIALKVLVSGANSIHVYAERALSHDLWDTPLYVVLAKKGEPTAIVREPFEGEHRNILATNSLLAFCESRRCKDMNIAILPLLFVDELEDKHKFIGASLRKDSST